MRHWRRRHWSRVSALGVAFLAIAAPAQAESVSFYFNYGAPAPCGATFGCIGVQYGIPGSCELSPKFIDAGSIPEGARVTSVTVRIHGWQSGTGVEVTPTIQGEPVATMVDALPLDAACDCEQTPVCAATAFSSASYPNGWPGWNYQEPGNQLDIEVTASDGGIIVDAVTVDVFFNTPIPAMSLQGTLLLAALVVALLYVGVWRRLKRHRATDVT